MKLLLAACLSSLIFSACSSTNNTISNVQFEQISGGGIITRCDGSVRLVQVEEGDTLLRLVVRNVKVRATVEQKGWANPVVATEIVARANHLESRDSIRAGQWLALPEFCDSTFN